MTDDAALIARLRVTYPTGRTCSEAAARIAALTAERDELRDGDYGVNKLAQRVAQAEIERDEANDKVRQLRIIANVNGDWNIKYGEAVDRAEQAEAERDALRELLAAIAPRWDAMTNGRIWTADVAGLMASIRNRIDAALAGANGKR